jgi:hypothetical protein
MLGLGILLSILWTTGAEAGPLSRSCATLVKSNPELLKKCVSHSEFFELTAGFIQECTNFHSDVEVRMKCLKSGANLEILKVCKAAKWSLDGTLTCLRSYPSEELVRSCKKISDEEEQQIRCVRSGVDHSQVEACLTMSKNLEQRFMCMKMDIPTLEANRCERISQNEAGRYSCLQDFMAMRERDYKMDQKEVRSRMLASEKEPVYEDKDAEILHQEPWPGKLKGIPLLK